MEYDKRKLETMSYKELCEYSILIGGNITDLRTLLKEVEMEKVRRTSLKECKI